ncbi:hypothetical protein FBU59_005608, partial [Linderina macrospora]
RGYRRAATDASRQEEISRTIYVGNIAALVDERTLLEFFSACGPVAYVKMAGDGLQPTRFAFVEFADQQSAGTALAMNGAALAERALKVNRSKNAINKPLVVMSNQRTGGAGTAAAGGSGMVVVPQMPQVATLAAVASLPSNLDPANFAKPSEVSEGIAWPVLGKVKPVEDSMRRVREAHGRGKETQLVGAQTELESSAQF